MLIFFLILFAILFAVFLIGMNPSILKYVLVAVSLLGLLGTVVMFSGNDNHHWGMKKTTATTDVPLAATANMEGTNSLLYTDLGNGKERIFIYKTNASQKKPKTTTADITTTNHLQRSGNVSDPVLETVTHQWTYKNAWFRLLYAGTNSNNRFDHEVNTFKVPRSWVVLSTTQVTQLQKAAKTSQAQAKAQMKAAIQSAVMKARQANPNMTAQQQALLVKKLTVQAQAQMAKTVAVKLQALSLQ